MDLVLDPGVNMDIAEYLKRTRMDLSGTPDLQALQSMQQLPVSATADAVEDPAIDADAASNKAPSNNSNQPTLQQAPATPPVSTGTNTDASPENQRQTDEGISTNVSSPTVAAPPSTEQANSGMPSSSLYQPGQAMQNYQKAISLGPHTSDYKPSIGRRILAGLAGGLTGLKNPALGVQVAGDTIHAPFDAANSEYQHDLSDKAKLAQLEAGQSAAGQKYYQDLAKIQHEQAGSAQDLAHQGYYERGGLPNFIKTPEQAFTYRAAQHPSALAHEEGVVTLNDGTQASGFRDPATRTLYRANGTPFNTEDIKDFKVNAKASATPRDPTIYHITMNDGKVVPGFMEADGNYTSVSGQKIPRESVTDVEKKPTTEGEDKGQVGQLEAANRIVNDPKASPDKKAAAKMFLKNFTSETTDRDSAANDRTQALAQRSYDASTKYLDATRKPVEDLRNSLSTLEDNVKHINVNNAGLIAPQLVKAVVGGAGSGIRITKAEIIGAIPRTIWQSIQDKVSSNGLDPAHQIPYSPEEIQAIKSLTALVRQKADAKSQLLNQADMDLAANPTDINKHKQIISKVKSDLSDTNADRSGSSITMQLPNGTKVPNIDPSKKDAFIKKYPGSIEAK